MQSFVIPADYCIALIDTATYPSFVDTNWTLQQIREHFVTQMNDRTMLAWGTGASGNWRVNVATGPGDIQGYREFTGRIAAIGTKLHLTSYEELTMAAQFKDVELPQQGTEGWCISVRAGEYDCRVVQFYDPAEAESEEVFQQATPHFLLVISEASRAKPSLFEKVPWFVEAD
jgi:hypothetical protein